jgi:predicted XRE-type DNA-binding protein
MAITSIPAELRTSKRDAAFWRRIDVRDSDQCWLWKIDTQLTQGGYGAAFYGSIFTTAHRIAYMLARGPIPEGLELLHDCDVRRCCNPWHAQPGTSQDNTDDMVDKGRQRLRRPPVGEINPNAKLRDADVSRIHELAASGLSQRKIAAALGISKTQVGNILRGESRTTKTPPK